MKVLSDFVAYTNVDIYHYIGWENMADIFKFIFCLELDIVLHKFQMVSLYWFSPLFIPHLTHLLLDKMAAVITDDMFKCIFMNKKFSTLIWISLRFVPKGSIDNKSALVQVMAWRLTGNKPLPEQWWTRTTRTPAFWDTPRCPLITHTNLGWR